MVRGTCVKGYIRWINTMYMLYKVNY